MNDWCSLPPQTDESGSGSQITNTRQIDSRRTKSPGPAPQASSVSSEFKSEVQQVYKEMSQLAITVSKGVSIGRYVPLPPPTIDLSSQDLAPPPPCGIVSAPPPPPLSVGADGDALLPPDHPLAALLKRTIRGATAPIAPTVANPAVTPSVIPPPIERKALRSLRKPLFPIHGSSQKIPEIRKMENILDTS